jgi:hypothetical protein
VRMRLRYYSGSAPQTEFEAQTSGAFDRITRRRGDGNPMKAIAGLCAASVLSLLLHALHSGSSPSALPDPRRTPGAVDARIPLHRSSPQRFRGRSPDPSGDRGRASRPSQSLARTARCARRLGLQAQGFSRKSAVSARVRRACAARRGAAGNRPQLDRRSPEICSGRSVRHHNAAEQLGSRMLRPTKQNHAEHRQHRADRCHADRSLRQ